MDAKLTLKLEKEVIAQAKRYARQQNQSLSRLIENLLRGVVAGKTAESPAEITPRVKRLSGVLDFLPDLNEQKVIADYLTEKYR